MALADDGDVPRLLLFGRDYGFEPRVADAIDFARVSRVLLLKHEPSGIEIDLSLAGLPFEREVIERAVERSVREVSFRVATPEDIVVMKAIAMRPRDIADIGAILDAGHELDLTRIRVIGASQRGRDGVQGASAIPTTPALRAGSAASGVGRCIASQGEPYGSELARFLGHSAGYRGLVRRGGARAESGARSAKGVLSTTPDHWRSNEAV